MTRAAKDTVDTAWHEAGHAAIAAALGMPIASVRVEPERAKVGRLAGRTQVDPLYLVTGGASNDALRLQALAGDAVDRRRGVRSGAHILEVSAEVGANAFGPLWAEAQRLVEQEWPQVELIASAILMTADLGLYPPGGDVLAAARAIVGD